MVDRCSLVVAFVFLLLFESTFEQQIRQPLASPAEKSALLGLRSSLGLRSKDWPIKLDPCLNWTGIACANGSVVGINVSGLKRTRLGRQNPQFAVDSLANLTNLVSFNASGFLLPGSIPDWFGSSLLNLQVLDLRSCSVNGLIPLSVGNLTGLIGLYLSDNSITGEIPVALGQLVNLSILDLSRNSLTGSIPSSFASLGNLTILDISSNYLSGSIPLGIGSLLKLQSLNLSSNSLTSSIPPQLGNLSSLVDIDLSFNGLSGSVPVDLSGMRNLQRMLFGHNALGGSLSDNLFPSTSQLQVVVLRQNSFTDAVPDVLWTLPGLNLLDVSGNNFTGSLPNSSLTSNATASVLNISSNLFYGDLTPLLGKYCSMDLSGNYFEGKIPANLPNNASLGSNCLQNVSNQRNSTECSLFYAEKGLVFDNFGLPNSTQSPKTGSRKSKVKIIILAVVLGAVALLALVVALLLLVRCTFKKDPANQRAVEAQSVAARDSPPPAGAATINFSKLGVAFTYEQLLQATLDFNDENLIKHGHSGALFKGLMEGGIPVVIKRIDLQSIKVESYMLELEFFSKASHTRLVPLLGYCLEKEDEKFFVYKYMPNGDLSSSLYREGDTGDDDIHSLDWITRLKIAIGAAEGLSYLHHECTPPFVHRDVQASSILLDDKYEVRLGSLSEIGAQEGDGHQSRIGRLLRLPQLSEQGTSGSPTASCSYDIYCFGKVLLELVTGKLGISASNDTQVKEWLDQTLPYITIYDKELVTKIVDPSLIVDEDLLEEVWAMAIVARSCLNPKPSRRPLMRYILKALENPLKVVREENSSSARLRTTSSRGSWNAAVFGSWRSTSDLAVIPAASSAKEGPDGSKLHSGTSNSYSAEHSSSSRRRHSREICPEPPGMMQDVERQEQEYQRD